ncbi:ROK family protein (plasmid) [Vagococcus lutrae]|uniref:ROK family protein n=1 Tax=Vagococcus lutrae TaxID=81947 RepID=UPI00232F1FFD|nr:ROK family protein [Vagococcus lutrae]WCG06118.1 ROK family protein [Vagococcus lutrae]
MQYFCIDIGGTYIKYGIIDSEDHFIKKWKKATPHTLKMFEKELTLEILKVKNEVAGIAVSCPGHVDSDVGYIYTGGSLVFLNNYPLKNLISSYVNLPISIINDGKAVALAEWEKGNLRETTNSAAVVLGTGVGGGLILNNKLYNGRNFQAGEFSFILNKPYAPDLFASYGSSVSFIEKAAEILDIHKDNYLMIFHAIEINMSKKLNVLFDDYCKNIALLIFNLQMILDLEKVVVGGSISRQDILIWNIKRQYRALMKSNSLIEKNFKPISVEACRFKGDSNLIGAFYHFKNVRKLNS